MSSLVRLLGRRYNASAGVWSDQPVLAEQESSQSPLMQVFILEPEEMIYLNPMRTDWWMHLGNTSALPILAKKIEICNPTFGDLTFRLAIMAVEDGTPGTGNAFLAWDTVIGAGEVWRWEGELALSGRYLYGRASGEGLTVLVEYVFGTGLILIYPSLRHHLIGQGRICCTRPEVGRSRMSDFWRSRSITKAWLEPGNSVWSRM